MNTQLPGPKHARADVGRAHRGRSLLAAAAASLVALTGLSGIALASDEDETPTPSTSASSSQIGATEGAPSDETQPTGDAGTISSGTAGESSAATDESATLEAPAATPETDVPAAPEPTATTPSKAPPSIQTRDTQVQPLAAGPEATSSPFIYWEARSTAAGNALVSGAIFEVQGPRTSGNGDDNDNRWSSNTITVEDNIGQSGYIGADLDPDPGEFQVQKIGSHTVSARNRYRIQKVAAPYGYGVGNVSWVVTPASSANPTTPASGAWTGSPLRWEPDDFRFASLTRNHTITVNKGDLRSDVDGGTTEISISSKYAQGARFALYRTSTSATELAQCTTDGSGKCVFGNVNADGVLWVGELDPQAGSPASAQYSAPLGDLTTGQGTSSDPFVDRPYRYATSSLSSSTNENVVVPSTPSTTDSWNQSSGRYVNRLANPKLTQTCAAGVKVAVVMDLSGSVNGYQNKLAQATTQLVDGLTGTPSSVALFSFSTESPATKWDNGNTNSVLLQNHPKLQSVQEASGANTVKSWYSESGSNGQTANFTPSGGTNWDLGLWEAAQGSTVDNHYDVVFVLTDGNPTFSGKSVRAGSGKLTTFRELERAVASSNVLKETGSRVITVGIGAGLSDYNLSAISGTAKYTAGDGINDFDYVSSDWSQLKQVMSAFAQGLSCQATVTVEKQAQRYGDGLAAASGWSFELSQEGASQQTPPGAGQVTDSNGQATWTLTFAKATDKASVTLTELEDRTGWSLTGITCDVGGVAVDLANKKVGLSGIGIGENVKCTFTNVESQVGVLAIAKQFDGSVPTGTSGEFSGTYACTLNGVNVASGSWSIEGTGTASLVAADGSAAPDRIPAGSSCSVAENAPVGGLPDGSWVWGAATITGPVAIEGGQTSTVTVTNNTTRLLGLVTWNKVDQTGELLAGSEWTLNGPGIQDEGVKVVDCVQKDCAPGPYQDQDPLVGQFKLTALSWGTYSLTEATSPLGYVRDTEPHEFKIDADNLVVTLESITNEQATPPSLPLTGGLGTDTFLLAGGGLLALAGIGGWIHRRRSQRLRMA